MHLSLNRSRCREAAAERYSCLHIGRANCGPECGSPANQRSTIRHPFASTTTPLSTFAQHIFKLFPSDFNNSHHTITKQSHFPHLPTLLIYELGRPAAEIVREAPARSPNRAARFAHPPNLRASETSSADWFWSRVFLIKPETECLPHPHHTFDCSSWSLDTPYSLLGPLPIASFPASIPSARHTYTCIPLRRTVHLDHRPLYSAQPNINFKS